MKKLFAILLAVTLLATMALPTFAATALTDSSATNKGPGDYTLDVNGAFVAGSKAGYKISVDIAWDEMKFTYNEVGASYDSTTHKYTPATGSWSTNKAGITITNHSNVKIDVDFSFAGTAGITGSFTKDSVSVESADDEKYQIAGADGKYPAPSDKTEFGIDRTSASIGAKTRIGTVTVTVRAPKPTVHVTTAAQLLEAVKTDGTVILDNDIDIGTETLVIGIFRGDVLNVVLDLNGHALRGAPPEGEAVVAVVNCNATVKNGTVENTSTISTTVLNNNNLGNTMFLVLEGCTFKCTKMDNKATALYIHGNTKMTDCTVITYNEECDIYLPGKDYVSDELLLKFELSGAVNARIVIGEEATTLSSGWKLIAGAGTYNFDPTAYVDTDNYTVTPNSSESPTSWTVTAKA